MRYPLQACPAAGPAPQPPSTRIRIAHQSRVVRTDLDTAHQAMCPAGKFAEPVFATPLWVPLARAVLVRISREPLDLYATSSDHEKSKRICFAWPPLSPS